MDTLQEKNNNYKQNQAEMSIKHILFTFMIKRLLLDVYQNNEIQEQSH